jgi:type IV pilus assembly protein PilQ
MKRIHWEQFMAFTVTEKVIARNYSTESEGKNAGIHKLWHASCGATKGRLRTVMFSLLAFTCFAANANAARMSDIEFSALPGDKTEIRMTFDDRPPVPAGYTIEQPARIALDLVGVRSGLDSKYHSLGTGNARSVTVVEAGDRTRIIVSLGELVAYSTRIEGNSLYVLVGKQNSVSFVADSDNSISNEIDQPMDSAYDSGGAARIEEIDFRRGELGEGRVIVRLSDPSIDVDISYDGGKIRVEFEDTLIPEQLQRRLDVTDFATPVLSIDSLPEGGNTVLLVEPTGDYDYLAYQADEIFSLEVKPLTREELETNRDKTFRYRGEKLSLNFQDVEIRAVLQLIADFTDLNLVASDTVAGRITLRLKNVPWDQALDIIMKTKGLDKREIGNVLMVGPAAELQAREKQELESRQQISELAPLRTEFIEIRYASASEIFALFQGAATGQGEEGSTGGNNGVISKRGSVIVDERTNSIILTETAGKIAEFRAVLDKLDVPVRQVLIEARIVSASSNVTESLGVRWGGLGTGSYRNGDYSTFAGGSLDTVNEIRTPSDDGTIGFTSPDHLVVDLGAQGSNATSFAIGVVSGSYLLDLEISALENLGEAEVIGRPKVITADKQEASISSGQEIPYESATGGEGLGGASGTTTSFKEVELKLTVRPQITPDDRIIMKLDVKQDTVGAVTAGGLSIDTNNIVTQVLVNNGETIVLGGVYNTNTTRSISKTPFLGDIPYLGRLFKRNIDQTQKSELLIFITPRIIEDSLRSR